MRTALYTVALGAALLLTASTASVRAEDRDCTVDLKSMCAGIAPGRGTHSGVYPGAHERTLRGLLVKAVEGCMGLRRVQRRHPALLPPSHLWQHYRLHEAASRRGQRPMQGGDRIHCLPRRRLAAPRRNGDGSRREANTRTEWRKARREKA